MQNSPIDFNHIGKQTTQLLNQFTGQGQAMEGLAPIVRGFSELAYSMASNPEKLMKMHMDLYQSTLSMWTTMAQRTMGQNPDPVVAPQKDDHRFTSDNWQNQMSFDFIKQSYLLMAKWMMDSVNDSKGLDNHTQMKVSFYTRQFLDAMSPSNFLLTNPDVLEETVKTGGQNLIKGLQNLMEDMKKGRISMTDESAFEIGENLAITKGKVIFRNKMIELIQYSPSTPKVNAKPVLICPPWINRFYIMDLQAKNSFVKYAVDQGLQVFMISWKNPDESYRDVGFEDYVKDGLLKAIDATLAITGQKDLNAIGYCIAGSMLTATLAALAKKKDKRISSATFITTLMDFTDSGEINTFIDEDQFRSLEKKMDKKGYLDGKDMALSFAMLRSNDLIWNFVINNYLMGKTPMPFDMFYWNSHSTRMPAAMHKYYLRNMYLENNLIKKNKMELLGEKIDISQIDIPIYSINGTSDHITPWKGCYSSFPNMKSKDITFLLAKAGHVGGMVNPPTKPGKPVKKIFWAGQVAGEKDPDKWLKKQKELKDSWWSHWVKWAKARSGEEVTAPKKAGNAKYKVICAAPGTYVKE